MTVLTSVLALSPNYLTSMQSLSYAHPAVVWIRPIVSFIQGANTLDGSFAFKEMGSSVYQVNSHSRSRLFVYACEAILQ